MLERSFVHFQNNKCSFYIAGRAEDTKNIGVARDFVCWRYYLIPMVKKNGGAVDV